MTGRWSIHPPVFAEIEFEVDVKKRKARLAVEGYIEQRGEPIINPVTGKEFRGRIDLPGGRISAGTLGFAAPRVAAWTVLRGVLLDADAFAFRWRSDEPVVGRRDCHGCSYRKGFAERGVICANGRDYRGRGRHIDRLPVVVDRGEK